MDITLLPKPAEKEEDMDYIISSKRQGKSIPQIVVELSKKRPYYVDTRYVTNLLRYYTNNTNSVIDEDSIKFESIDNIDWVLQEAIKAWLKSTEVMEKRTIKQGPTDAKFKHIAKAKSQFQKGPEKIIEKLEAAGDPKFLDIILKCITTKAKIAGVLDNKKAETTLRDLLAQLDITDTNIEHGRILNEPLTSEEEVLALDAVNAFTPKLKSPVEELEDYEYE